MAVTTESSTGANTSGATQAVVKVAVGGCITQALKTSLESQLVIEFPDAIDATAGLAALSSVAVNQIVAQLVVSPDFDTLLGAKLSEQTYVDQVVASILASDTFKVDLTTAINTALASAENIATIETALCASESFQTCVTTFVVASTAAATLVDARIETALNALDTFVCAEQDHEVNAALTVNIPVTGMVTNDYFVSYVVTQYTGGGNTDNAVAQTGTRTPTFYPITFPNTAPGDTVRIHSVRIKCD